MRKEQVLRRWFILLLWSVASVVLTIGIWSLLKWPVNVLWILGVITGFGVVGGLLFLAPGGIVSLQSFTPMLIVVSIVFPFIRLPSVPDVRPELVIVLAALGLWGLSYLLKPSSVRLRLFPVYKWFVFFGVAIVVSMSYANWFKGEPIIWRDFWELVKLLVYLLIFAFVANQRVEPQTIARNYRIALIAFAFSALLGFLQYIHFPGVNEVISPYYAPRHLRGIVVHGRITGTMPNPNEFGALMVLAIALALTGVLYFQDKKWRWLCGGLLFVYGIALILTMSRSSLGALVLMGGTVMLLSLKRMGRKGRRRIVMAFILLGFIGLAIMPFVPQHARLRFSQIPQFTESTSWQVRMEQWEVHFDLWRQSPWLGWGPGKSNMDNLTIAVDNDWLLLLRRYGVVGVGLFIMLARSFFKSLSYIRKQSDAPSVVALVIALQGVLVGYAFYMFLVPVYHTLQLASVLFLFLGMAFSQWETMPRYKR